MEIRDQRICNWYWADNNVYEVYAQRIGLMAFAVYNALCRYSNSGKCWPSLQTIADKLGTSRRSVMRAITVLEEHRLVVIESGKVAGQPNVYALLPLMGGVTPEHQGCDTSVIPGVTNETGGVGHHGTTNNTNRTKLLNNQEPPAPKHKDSLEDIQKENFEHLWAQYPYKEGKKDAWKYFKASVKNADDWGRICTALGHYLKSQVVLAGYPKKGDKWFRNWEDWEHGDPRISSTGGSSLD